MRPWNRFVSIRWWHTCGRFILNFTWSYNLLTLPVLLIRALNLSFVAWRFFLRWFHIIIIHLNTIVSLLIKLRWLNIVLKFCSWTLLSLILYHSHCLYRFNCCFSHLFYLVQLWLIQYIQYIILEWSQWFF
jgi:hypothetical protein